MARLTLFLWVALVAPSAAATNECYKFQCPHDDAARCPRVVTPKDASYDEDRAQWASKMSSSTVSDARLHPEMIFFCSEKDHVVETINFARKCEYKVSVRSGGHQYAGFSSCVEGQPCIQLDVGGLETFESGVDGVPNRLTLGVGLRLQDVSEKLLPMNLSIPMGICKSVGVGGHFQSSSAGFLIKSFGLGMDRVVAFEIAKADGSIAKVTPESDPELYWAVLGGSPGSWGVLLSYTLDAIASEDHPHTQVGYFVLPYTREIFVTVTNNLMKLSADEENARDFTAGLYVGKIDATPDADTGLWPHYIIIWALYTGIDNGPWTPALEEKWLTPLINPSAGVAPLFAPRPWGPVSMSEAVNTVLQTSFDNGDYHYHVHSMSVNKWFNETWVEAAATELDERMKIPYMYSSFQFYSFGGEGPYGSQLVRNFGRNAYPLRDTKIHMDDWFFFRNDDADAEVAAERIEKFRESTQVAWEGDNSAERSWMTTLTVDSNADLLTAPAEDKFDDYFPHEGWFHRLTAVKDTVDPTDLFSSLMTIPTTASRTARSQPSQLLAVARRHSYEPSV